MNGKRGAFSSEDAPQLAVVFFTRQLKLMNG
jgi:hypothetical protein